MPPNSKQALLKLKKLAQNDSSIETLWLYGSQADGSAQEHSDIDLAVMYQDYLQDPVERRLRPELTALDWQKKLALQEKDLSVIDIRQVPIPLAFSVIQAGKILLSKNKGQCMLEEQRIMSMWEEYQYQYQRYA